MYQELQIVKAVRNLSEKVIKDCIGTIIYVHSECPEAYEVEFVNSKMETIDILTVTDNDITL